jgi:hypothetical protein
MQHNKPETNDTEYKRQRSKARKARKEHQERDYISFSERMAIEEGFHPLSVGNLRPLSPPIDWEEENKINNLIIDYMCSYIINNLF